MKKFKVSIFGISPEYTFRENELNNFGKIPKIVQTMFGEILNKKIVKQLEIRDIF